MKVCQSMFLFNLQSIGCKNARGKQNYVHGWICFSRDRLQSWVHVLIVDLHHSPRRTQSSSLWRCQFLWSCGYLTRTGWSLPRWRSDSQSGLRLLMSLSYIERTNRVLHLASCTWHPTQRICTRAQCGNYRANVKVIKYSNNLSYCISI